MRLDRALVTSALFACAAVLAACHASESEKPAAAPPADAPPAAAGAWEGMSKEQRANYMKETVLPKMRPLFAAYDADDFKEMKCGACHGAGAKDKSFKMPNPDLPPLPTDPEGWKKLETEEAEAVKFMKETVVPTMAALLGEKPFDPATHSGFGCFECHTQKK
jgi:hypothetical protein